MQQRRRMGIVWLILIGLAIGMFLKNVKIGLIIGLLLGVSAGNLIGGSSRRK